MVELGDDAGQVTDAVAVRVGVGAGIDLVEDAAVPPAVRVGFRRPSVRLPPRSCRRRPGAGAGHVGGLVGEQEAHDGSRGPSGRASRDPAACSATRASSAAGHGPVAAPGVGGVDRARDEVDSDAVVTRAGSPVAIGSGRTARPSDGASRPAGRGRPPWPRWRTCRRRPSPGWPRADSRAGFGMSVAAARRFTSSTRHAVVVDQLVTGAGPPMSGRWTSPPPVPLEGGDAAATPTQVRSGSMSTVRRRARRAPRSAGARRPSPVAVRAPRCARPRPGRALLHRARAAPGDHTPERGDWLPRLGCRLTGTRRPPRPGCRACLRASSRAVTKSPATPGPSPHAASGSFAVRADRCPWPPWALAIRRALRDPPAGSPPHREENVLDPSGIRARRGFRLRSARRPPREMLAERGGEGVADRGEGRSGCRACRGPWRRG